MVLLKSDSMLVKVMLLVLVGKSNTQEPFFVGLLFNKYGTNDKFLLIFSIPALLLDWE